MRIVLIVAVMLASAMAFATQQPPACVPTPGGHCVDLWWDTMPNALSYTLYASTSASGICVAANRLKTGLTVATFTDMAPTLGATMTYAVSAVYAGGESACSVSVQALIGAPGAAPTNPNLKVS